MDAITTFVGATPEVLGVVSTSRSGGASPPAGVCENGGTVCRQLYDWTGSDSVADWVSWLLGKPLAILLAVVLGWIATRIARRVIGKSMQQIRKGALNADQYSGGALALDASTRVRLEQRTDTLGGVLTSVSKVVIWSIVFLVIIGELGIDLAPLLAGAGVAGIAIGFGAQTVVRDFLSGFFMLAEDQFGVGDVVDVGEATGTVERITMRTTVLRDVYGTVWHVPNGEIMRVGNKSQLWANALIDVGIAYEADVDRASEVIARAAHDLYEDPEWPVILAEPEVLGVQDLAADAVTIRLSVRTEPAAQFRVERELRRRIKAALDDAAIEIPFPQRTVWVRMPEPDAAAG